MYVWPPRARPIAGLRQRAVADQPAVLEQLAPAVRAAHSDRALAHGGEHRIAGGRVEEPLQARVRPLWRSPVAAWTSLLSSSAVPSLLGAVEQPTRQHTPISHRYVCQSNVFHSSSPFYN